MEVMKMALERYLEGRGTEFTYLLNVYLFGCILRLCGIRRDLRCGTGALQQWRTGSVRLWHAGSVAAVCLLSGLWTCTISVP